MAGEEAAAPLETIERYSAETLEHHRSVGGSARGILVEDSAQHRPQPMFVQARRDRHGLGRELLVEHLRQGGAPMTL